MEGKSKGRSVIHNEIMEGKAKGRSVIQNEIETVKMQSINCSAEILQAKVADFCYDCLFQMIHVTA